MTITKKEAFSKFKAPNKIGNTLLLTHTDLDGSGPVMLLSTIFPNLTVQHCSNNTMSYDIKNAVCNPHVSQQYANIFAVDISCNEEDAVKINTNPNNKKLILLDHHQTASHLNQYKWATVCVEELKDSYRQTYYPEESTALTSGTALLYNFLEYSNMFKDCKNINMEHMQKAVHIIAAYDAWDWYNVFEKSPYIQQLNKLHQIYGCNRMEKKLLEYVTSNAELYNSTDQLLLDIHQEKIDNYLDAIENCFKTGNLIMNNKYYSIVFCNTHDYPAETFERMKENYPDYDLYMLNYGTGISMRATKDDINVGALLKGLGGGGHAGAGGIKIEQDLQRMLIEQTLQAQLIIDAPEDRPLPRKQKTSNRETPSYNTSSTSDYQKGLN